MKKILITLAVVGFLGALVVGVAALNGKGKQKVEAAHA